MFNCHCGFPPEEGSSAYWTQCTPYIRCQAGRGAISGRFVALPRRLLLLNYWTLLLTTLHQTIKLAYRYGLKQGWQ